MKTILLTVCATCLIQLGYFIWKITLKDLPRLGEAKIWTCIHAFLCSWQWMMGMALRLLGLALFIKATSMGDISLIQPLMSAGDIFFVFLVCVFLKERLVALEWVGLAFTFLGSVAISFEAKDINVVDINALRMEIFAVITLFALTVPVILRERCQKSEVFWGLSVGAIFGVSAIFIKLMTAQQGWFYPMLWPILAVNILGLIFLQLAFQNGRAAVIFPIQVAASIMLSVIGGLYLFSEKISLYRLACIGFIIIGTALFQYATKYKIPTMLRTETP